MDAWWIELVPALAMAIALAACAGLRAWLPLLLTGALARAGVLELGRAFEFLGSDRALILFGTATVIELVADKFPAVDHALDAISTVLRPAAGTLLAASVLWPISDPLSAVVVGALVGAPAAAVPHAAKSALRAVSTTLTAGLANPVISLIEDVIALALFALAVAVPVAVVCGLLLATYFLARRASARRPQPAPAA